MLINNTGEGKTMTPKNVKVTRLILLGIICLFLTTGSLFAQQARILSLEETLMIALNESYDIKDQQFRLEQSNLSLESRLRGQKTRIDLRWWAPTWNKGIAFDNTKSGTDYFDEDRISTRATLEISQPVLYTDGRFYVEGKYSTLDLYLEDGNSTTQRWTDDITINYSQPLFQPNTQRLQLNSTKRNLEMAEKRFEGTQNMIYFNVIRTYFELVQAKKQLEIDTEDVQQKEQNHNNTMNKYRAGIMAEVDALKTQVELDEARINNKTSELNYQKQLDEFKRYIGLSLDENIDVSSDVNVQIIDIDSEKAFLEAFARDAAIKNQELEILNSKDRVETTKNERKFKANLALSYGLNEQDPIDSYLRDNLFRQMSRTNSVSLDFTIPIFDWGQHKLDVENSLISVKSNELDLENNKLVLKRSVQDIINNIENANDKMDIQERTEELAQKQYDITVERYNIGEINSDELFQSSSRLKRAKLNVLSAQIQYQKAIANLQMTTYWDFQNNRPLSETLTQYIK